MKVMPVLLVLVLFSAVEAQTAPRQCVRAEFTGEATQDNAFTQDLGEGIRFSVFPMRMKEDARWGWFQIRVIGGDEDGIFAFNPSDLNWLLATDFRSAFIGGPNSDVKASLTYRLRYFIFPISRDNKQQLRGAANRLVFAQTPGETGNATAALNSMPLGQIRFEITDYGLAGGEPPTSVEWVQFTSTVTLPPGFVMSRQLSPSYVECPAIPEEVIDNIRDQKRHDYFLQPKPTSNAER
jgi:hypothetical protein